MPASGITWLPHDEILTYNEILRIAKAFAGLGVKKIRLTGGEPLVRKGLVGLVKSLSDIEGIEEICLTTNGVLLKEHAQAIFRAGVRRVNISLDTLKSGRFEQITGRDVFFQVMEGIETALKTGFKPVKLNAVVVRGVNDSEIADLAAMSIKQPFHVRFIEYMPVGEHSVWDDSTYMPADEIREKAEQTLGQLFPMPQSKKSGPAEIFAFKDALGTVGFISPVSRHFCATCNRVRLTPDGRLRLCLFSDNDVDLKRHLRSGVSDGSLVDILKTAIAMKPSGHGCQNGIGLGCQRGMSKIGG